MFDVTRTPLFLYRDCEIGMVFGSFGISYSQHKTFNLYNIPAYRIEVELTYVIYGSWPWSSHTDIYLDTNYIYFYPTQITVTQLDCGQSYSRTLGITSNKDTLYIRCLCNVNHLWGLRDLRIYQLLCDTSCSSCNGPNPNNCLSCYPLASLSNGICTCIDYHYIEEFCSPPIPCTSAPYSACRRCHLSCKTCAGPTENECLSCFFTDVLINGKCQSETCKNFNKKKYYFLFLKKTDKRLNNK